MARAAILAFLATARIWAQQTPTPRLEFEVASVQPLASSGHFIQAGPVNLATRISGNGFRMRQTTVPVLIMAAYNLREDQFIGLPDWADDTHSYEIVAKAADPLTVDQARLMLQNLLADRFHIQVRRETKNQTVYELTVGPEGLKIEVTPERTTGNALDPWPALPALIGGYLDHPIVDKTGLKGFILGDAPKWDNAKLQEESIAVRRESNLPPGVFYHGLAPSIFRETEKAFGLKLTKVTEPGDFLVIEHIERPTQN